MLALNQVTYRIAGRTLLEGASLNVQTGYRVGLVGPNGTGKSTLFKLIAGELELDNGEITVMAGTKIGMVRQDLPDDDTSLLDVVLSADTERASLLQEAETSDDAERLADIYTRLGDIDAYGAPARASLILTGLGFDHNVQDRPIKDFSGGWKMRVALAAALFMQPELLLLDEPTNHLDFEAIVWLENYLMQYPYTVVLISHDRDILNKTVTHIAHLDQQKLTMYTGSYDDFEMRRAQALMNQQALFERQQAHKKRVMGFVTRFGAKASKARQAQSRLKSLEKMDMVDAIIADRATQFKFPQPEPLGSPMITIDDVNIGYEPNKPILKNVHLSIGMDDRIALLGANGNGKSTLVKLISDKLQPLSGHIERNSKLRVGYFAQHQTDELDIELTPFETLRYVMTGYKEHDVRAILGRFGFTKIKADTKIAGLSGGEKARLLFCMMSYHAPHIMLLDEPTNHLDMDARSALIQALNDYEGCVILVSHDPHLVEAVADQLWLVKDSKVEPYDDDLEGYRRLVMDQRRKEKSDQKKEKKAEKSKKSENKKSKVNEYTLKKAEERIVNIAAKKQQLEKRLEDREVASDPKQMTILLQEYQEVDAELKQAEEEWVALQNLY